MNFKKLAAVLAVGVSIMSVAGCDLVVKTDDAKVKDAEKVAATVIAKGEGFTVTQKDIDDKYALMLKQIQAQYGDETLRSDTMKSYLEAQKQSIMDQLIRVHLLDKKIVSMNIPETSDEMTKKYDELIASNITAFGDKAKFEDAVKAAGYTMESYKTEIMKNLRYDALLAEVTKDIKVEDKEIQDYYDAQKDTAYTKHPGAKIYHIFFGTPDAEGAEAKAKEAKEKLNAGASFEEISKEYGKDGAAASGGLLGEYPYDTTELGADFMEIVKTLKEGEVSDPVKTSFGWHIIKVTDIKSENTVVPLEDVKAAISEEMKKNKIQERIAKSFDEWEKEYKVERHPDLIKQDTVPLPEPLPVVTPSTNTNPDSTTSTKPASSN